MSTTRNHIALLPTYIGAGLGMLAFLLIGAVPGVLYGGYMGLVMTEALFGHVDEVSMLARAVTGGGMVLGVLSSLFLFLVAGAFGGTLVGLPFARLLRSASAPAAVPSEVAVQSRSH